MKSKYKKRREARKKDSKKSVPKKGTLQEVKKDEAPQDVKNNGVKLNLSPEAPDKCIRVELRKTKTELLVNWASILLCASTIILVIYASQQIRIESKTLEHIKTNVKLTHKPVLFVKNSVPPQDENEIKDAKKHWFVITNSGRTPARNVRVKVRLDDVYGGEKLKIRGITIAEFTLIESTVVYPGQEIFFKISDEYIPLPLQNVGSWQKALISIILSYQGEDIEGESIETQHLIFSKETGYRWRIVGADFLRRVKRELEKKSK